MSDNTAINSSIPLSSLSSDCSETRSVPAEEPRVPVVSIRASRWFLAGSFSELLSYRELLFFLSWRDIKVRYRQAFLGVLWAVLQPVITVAIFTVLFGRLARMPSDGVPYPLFALCGLLPWLAFSSGVTNSGNSLVNSAHLITKVYFPRVLIPAAALAVSLVEFSIGLVVLVGLMWWYAVELSLQLLLVPLLLVHLTVLALAVGLFCSALNVKFRDVRHALPFVIQIWMFASPIIYPASMIPERWKWVWHLNPLAGVIEGFRAALLNRPFPWELWGGSLALSLSLFLFSLFYFGRTERSFADVI